MSNEMLRTDQVLKQINELSPEVLRAHSAHFNKLRFSANSAKDKASLAEFDRTIDAIDQRLAGAEVAVAPQPAYPTVPPANEPKSVKVAALDPFGEPGAPNTMPGVTMPKPTAPLAASKAALVEIADKLIADQKQIAEERKSLAAERRALAEERKALDSDRHVLADDTKKLDDARQKLVEDAERLRIERAAFNAEMEKLKKGRHLALCLDLSGALKIKKLYPGNAVTIFVEPPSINELRKRIEGRCARTKAVEVEKRIKLAVGELRHARRYDYVVKNKNLAKADNRLRDIILKEIGA